MGLRVGTDTWAELTLLTDFSDVDADDAIINLDRFPIFLPERRPFFLSGLDVFSFGIASRSQLFFSRRIGLEQDVLAGAKAYGRMGNLTFGALNVWTDAAPGASRVARDARAARDRGDVPSVLPASAANWAVARGRYDFDGRGHLGALIASRLRFGDDWQAYRDRGDHVGLGLDGSWRSKDARLRVNGFAAATRAPVLDPITASVTTVADTAGEMDRNRANPWGASAGLTLGYVGRNWQPTVSSLWVDKDFDPVVGLVRRRQVVESDLKTDWIFRPKVLGDRLGLESLSGGVVLGAVTDPQTGQRLGENLAASHTWAWKSKFSVAGEVGWFSDVVRRGFQIARRVEVAPGTYKMAYVQSTLRTPYLRNPQLELTVRHGQHYGGTKTDVTPTLTLSLTKHFRLVAATVFNRLVYAGAPAFVTTAINARANIAINNRMLMNLVGQYNSVAERFASQIRFRYRYLPGSDFIVVYQDQRLGPQGAASRDPRSTFAGLGDAWQANRDAWRFTVKVSHRFDGLL